MKRLLSAFLLIGCTPPPDLSLGGASSGTLRGPAGQVALNGSDMEKLGVVLTGLRGRKAEVTSKPDYVLTWQVDDEEHTVSFFVEESLVYPGEFLTAWTARMKGDAVVGAKLSAGTVAVLEGALSADAR